MPRDAQISNSSSEAAPKDYTIPGNAELVLRAVQATFTDNGASGDWLPCLTLISDSGHTIARACDQGVKVTAGSDASVSWFPDVTRAQVAASGGTSLPACRLSVSNPITLGTWSPPGYTSVTWAAMSTNDSAVFQFPGSGGNTTVKSLTSGFYRAAAVMTFQGFNFPVAPGLFLYTIAQSTLSTTRNSTQFSINHTNAAWAEGDTNASGRDAPHIEAFFNGAAGDWVLNTAWTGAGTITFTPQLFIYRVGDALV